MNNLSYTVKTGREEFTIDEVILMEFNYALTDIIVKRLRKEDMWKRIDIDCSDYSDWSFVNKHR